jgi:hypothetical protein
LFGGEDSEQSQTGFQFDQVIGLWKCWPKMLKVKCSDKQAIIVNVM